MGAFLFLYFLVYLLVVWVVGFILSLFLRFFGVRAAMVKGFAIVFAVPIIAAVAVVGAQTWKDRKAFQELCEEILDAPIEPIGQQSAVYVADFMVEPWSEIPIIGLAQFFEQFQVEEEIQSSDRRRLVTYRVVELEQCSGPRYLQGLDWCFERFEGVPRVALSYQSDRRQVLKVSFLHHILKSTVRLSDDRKQREWIQISLSALWPEGTFVKIFPRRMCTTRNLSRLEWLNIILTEKS